MQRPSLSRIAFLASQASEWLVLVILLAASTPAIFIHPRSLTVVPQLNLLDGSWLLDTSYKAANGIWFGRDVAFTYGPLFQWLSSAPSRWLGTSMGTVFATGDTLLLYVVVLATFLTARLLLPESAPWRRALLVLLAVVFWSPPDMRVSLCLLAFAFFLRLSDSVVAGKSSATAGALMAAAACIILFLISADSGIYATAAFLLCLWATSVTRGRMVRAARLLLVTVIFFAALGVAVNAAMRAPFDFRFWRSILAIATGYRWFEPLTMSKHDKHQLFAILAAGAAVFILAWLLRKPRGPWTRRPAYVLAGLGFALVAVQSNLVRSDRVHMLIGIYPLIFLCGAIALDEFEWPSWLSAILPVVVIVTTVALAHAFVFFTPGSVATLERQIVHPVLSCPQGMHEFDRACFSAIDAQLLSSVSGFVDAQTAPGSAIAIFPYQTALGLASRRQVAGGLLQGYLVNGEYLTQVEIAALKRANPAVALYFPDSLSSLTLDSVPSFTRSPDIWFYYFRHYRAVGEPSPGVLGLARDDSRDARIHFSSQSIGESPMPVAINKRSTTLDLGRARWPSEGADFLRLRLRVDYPLWWRVRKPSCLVLEMSFADGSRKSIQFVLPPNRSADIWVYPWEEKDMVGYFSGDQGQWRFSSHPALTSLRLVVTPFDWVSVVPNSVTVEAIEAVEISLS